MIEFHWNTRKMSRNQLKIADYINKNLQQVLLSTEQEIAAAVEVSIASVSRFWRVAGYDNFKDFKHRIRAKLEVSPAQKMKNIMHKPEGEEIFQYPTLEVVIHHLHQTLTHGYRSNFLQAVKLLHRADRIYLFAPGPSAGLAALMQYRIARFGYDISLLEKGGSELLEDVLHMKKTDVVLLFGFIRLLPEAKVILNRGKKVGYRTILVTDQLVSDFTHQANVTLFASRGELSEFHSMVAPTFLVENLIVALGMENREANLLRLEELSDLRKQYAAELPR
ncbi:DNA-binding transcriptional regulator, MurR/RpiR family, contains HTH and SIS domains [Evansella caseinilytica]|uniref:DNA-binding transcriptional regulator, MurR/RpiR family, contains HTH and SIS domains n=1 Tax=Evansella caseinilytica TaxID=1503961 RepID=A0A1H3IER4_9BACI|nr:MurR/RpiR family transcriptional regulator [Evansella caseinilytica]SDY26097.1 DNA-binding transcriptional regulator, MurR/RpiR family, contains HTH and SIS domains [Evansella caseinilytica]